MKFKVWDHLNRDEGDAREIDAYDASDAAESYAEDDPDGMLDGLYTKSNGMPLNSAMAGHPIMVLGEDGVPRKFLVGVTDMHPVFSSCEVNAGSAQSGPDPRVGEA